MNIKNMRKVDLGKTVAFFSVEFPGHLTINDCKLIKGRNGLFAAMPSRKYTDKTGQDKWQSIVYVEQDLLTKITVAAELVYQGVSVKPSSIPQTPDEDSIPF
jgi:DNA-binding cell septation regulator SpoVG